MLFVSLYHQLMQHNDIGVGQTYYRLNTQTHHRSAIIDDLNIAPGTRHMIYTLGGCRTWNFQISTPHKLTALLRSQYIMQKPIRPSFSRRQTFEIWLEDQPYHRRYRQR